MFAHGRPDRTIRAAFLFARGAAEAAAGNFAARIHYGLKILS
jgi:hypothetical protein